MINHLPSGRSIDLVDMTTIRGQFVAVQRLPTSLGLRTEFHVGIDIASVARIGSMAHRYSNAVLNRVFTLDELRAFDGHPGRERYLSICFAAKEAVGKALACGMVGIEWSDIEAAVKGTQLTIRLRGSAAEIADRLGVKEFAASWMEIAGESVIVLVIAQSREGDFGRGPA
jgi:holo-[acyl-carrier protein] synthase